MILVDAHAHLYSSLNLIENLVAGGERLLRYSSQCSTGALFLCEPVGRRYFEEFLEGKSATVLGKDDSEWQLRGVRDDASIELAGPSGKRIIVVRGKQLITKERLEVLAIGRWDFESDGISLFQTVESVVSAGGHAILPWGVGKWLGARGSLVLRAVEKFAESNFHLGDNGGRYRHWTVPQFEVARKNGVRVLSGTDCLPIDGDEIRLGTYGTQVGFASNDYRYWKDISRALLDDKVAIKTVGKLPGFCKFVSNQTRLRLYAKQ